MSLGGHLARRLPEICLQNVASRINGGGSISFGCWSSAKPENDKWMEEWRKIGNEWEEDEWERGDEYRKVAEWTEDGWESCGFTEEERECEGLGWEFLSFLNFLIWVLVREKENDWLRVLA